MLNSYAINTTSIQQQLDKITESQKYSDAMSAMPSQTQTIKNASNAFIKFAKQP